MSASAQISNNRCQSVELRASRDTSSPITTPATQAHFGDQELEAFAVDRRSPGLPEICVDDHHLIRSPPKTDGSLAKVILAPGALGVLEHLPQRRLAHVEISVPLEMSRLNFACSLSHVMPLLLPLLMPLLQ